MSWATSPGSFTVVDAATPVITAVTSPTTGAYLYGQPITVNWTTNVDVAAGDHFSVWARSSNLTSWFLMQANIATGIAGRSSFSYTYTLASAYTYLAWIPPGSYQMVVAYHNHASSAGTWQSWGTSVGNFTVAAAR